MTQVFKVVGAVSFEVKSFVLSTLENGKFSATEVEHPYHHLTKFLLDLWYNKLYWRD